MKRVSYITLVEVLITMVMIAVIVPVSVASLQHTQRVELSARRGQIAVDLAENLLYEKLNDPNSEIAAEEGSFEPEYVGYDYKIELEDWTVSDMQQVTVSVTYPLQDELRSIQVSTLVEL